MCAFKPDPPLIVTTTNVNDFVKVAWAAPITNGWPISEYKIYIREHSSSQFTQETLECDGTDATIISQRWCLIHLDTLKSAPYNLVKDEGVYAKIISINVYGESALSSAGNGALI